MLLNVFACLFASLAMLNVEAVEFASVAGYNGQTCTGPTAYVLPYSPTDICSEVISEFISNVSVKITCDALQVWYSSTTCSGEPDDVTPFTECHSIYNDEMSSETICEDYPNLVRVIMQYADCSSLNEDGYSPSSNLEAPTYVPVGVCFPDVLHSGLSSQVGAFLGQSFKVEKQPTGGYQVTRFYSDDCTGTTAVFSDVADGVCKEIGSGGGQTSTSTQAVLLEVIASTSSVGRRLRSEPNPLTLTPDQLKKFFPNLKL